MSAVGKADSSFEFVFVKAELLQKACDFFPALSCLPTLPRFEWLCQIDAHVGSLASSPISELGSGSSPVKMATALIVMVIPALRETLTRGTQLSHTQIPHPQN